MEELPLRNEHLDQSGISLVSCQQQAHKLTLLKKDVVFESDRLGLRRAAQPQRYSEPPGSDVDSAFLRFSLPSPRSRSLLQVRFVIVAVFVSLVMLLSLCSVHRRCSPGEDDPEEERRGDPFTRPELQCSIQLSFLGVFGPDQESFDRSNPAATFQTISLL